MFTGNMKKYPVTLAQHTCTLGGNSITVVVVPFQIDPIYSFEDEILLDRRPPVWSLTFVVWFRNSNVPENLDEKQDLENQSRSFVRIKMTQAGLKHTTSRFVL